MAAGAGKTITTKLQLLLVWGLHNRLSASSTTSSFCSVKAGCGMSPDPIVKFRKSNTKADAKWLSKITANFTICHETGKEMGKTSACIA